jgi:DNA-binding FadR family transcriptional regulator
MEQGTPRNRSGESAVDRVVAAFQEKIVSGELANGSSFPAERSIVDSMGVSRPVAREAIKILAGRGLLEIVPRHRPIVRSPDAESIIGALSGLVGHLIGRSGGTRQIFEIRIFVEAGLARQAATSATRDDITRLRTALEANGQATADSAKFYATDQEFHAALYSISGNPIFPAIHQAFNDWLAPKWDMMPRLPDRNLKNYKAHKAIVEAILDRDPDKAEAALRTHLDDAWQQVSNVFADI